MRVIHLLSALYQGGAETQLERLIDASENVEHVVVSLKDDITPLVHKLKKKNIEVLLCGVNGVWDVLSLLKLRRLFRDYANDQTVIQCWMYHANFLGWLASFGLSIPVFWNIRRTLVPQGMAGILSSAAALISQFSSIKIFCNSHRGIATHIASGYKATSFVYVPNCFDLTPSNTDLLDSVVDSYGANDINVCCVGRYDPVKGHVILLEAFYRLESFLSNDEWSRLRLFLVGRNIAEASDVRFLLDKLPLKDKIVFLGERSDVVNILNHMDIFCLPSMSEGFPNVLVEAMLAELPCVATNVGDVPLILPTDNIILEPGDSGALANALAQMIRKDLQERLDIGKKNRMSVIGRFGVDRSLSIYTAHYHKALGAG